MRPTAQPNRWLRSSWAELGLIVLLALIAAVPLWGVGIVNTRGGGDSPFLLQRTMDMAESLSHGVVPVRWMSHAAYDLGYPFFNHYAALPYYLSGALTALGISPLIAVQATQTLGMVLAALAMALWSHRIHRSRLGAMVSVVAYTFAPFHLVNLYVRGDSLSEFYAFAAYPLILWTLDRLADRQSFRRVLGAALAYASLILTHNVSLLIFSPFALLYILLRTRPKPLTLKTGLRWGMRAASPFVLGMLLTAWFWVPALIEVKYGQMDDAFTAGYFHYSRHFRGLNLVQSGFAFDYTIAGSEQAAGPFATGLTQAAFALLGVGALLARQIRSGISSALVGDRRRRVETTAFLLIGLLGSTLMITPLSKVLWDRLPFLGITQFPWRFLSIQALFTAAVTGCLISAPPPEVRIAEWQRLRWVGAAVIVGGALMLSAMIDLHPDRLAVNREDVSWENLLLYESFTGNIGTTIRYEYLPSAVVPRPYISGAVVDGQGTVIAEGSTALSAVQLERSPRRRHWQVDVPLGPARVVFPLHFWPGWRAEVDGTPVDVAPVEGSGRISLILPTGQHEVELRLGPTPLRTWTIVVSGLTGLAVVAAMLRTRRSPSASDPSPPSDDDRRRPILAALGLGALLAIVMPYAFHREAGTQARVFDFEKMPYPHAGPVDFGPAALVAAGPTQDEIQPGGSLTLPATFEIRAGESITGRLRLVSPAEPRHGVPYRLAERQFTLMCKQSAVCTETETYSLPIPNELPRGLYLIQLTLFDESGELRGRTAQGTAMGTLYVGAVRVPKGPSLPQDAPILGQFEQLTLHAVNLKQPNAATAHLTLAWSTPGTPRNWSHSIRLLDAGGRTLAQLDQQPGYGYLPTSLWHAGERVTEEVFLSLPEGLAPGRYTLKVITYLRATMTTGGEVDVPVELTRPTLYDLRDACCEQTRKGETILCEAEGIALLGVDRPDAIAQGDPLALSAEWNAVQHPTADLGVRWALIAPDGSDVTEVAGPIAPGSQTSAWPRHTWVETPVTIPLPPRLEPGEYAIRVTLTDGSETRTRCTLGQSVIVRDRPRTFEVPDLPSPQSARFGEPIRMLGYEMAHDQKSDTVELTLWWQARIGPQQDYKRFVHLYAPGTEEIVAQDDAMPRQWQYPTSWWAAGEVVSETLTLDLRDVPPGTYRAAVGWYNPETMDRLAARDASGERQPADRVILNTEIERR